MIRVINQSGTRSDMVNGLDEYDDPEDVDEMKAVV